MRETVEFLRPVLAGERGAGGFKLESAARRRRCRSCSPRCAARCSSSPPRRRDGAFTNFLPLSGLPRIVEAVRAGEEGAGREAGSVELACRFFCVPGSAEEGLATAKFLFAAYATVPVYTEFFRWLGWGEQLDPMVDAWHAGDRKRALELAPEDLVRDVFIFGSYDEQRARLRGVHGRRHHDRDPHADVRARPARGDDPRDSRPHERRRRRSSPAPRPGSARRPRRGSPLAACP